MNEFIVEGGLLKENTKVEVNVDTEMYNIEYHQQRIEESTIEIGKAKARIESMKQVVKNDETIDKEFKDKLEEIEFIEEVSEILQKDENNITI